MRWIGTVAVGILALALAAQAADGPLAASPMHSSGAMAVYPRLKSFPDAAVMARVNAALAAREKQDRASLDDCLAQAKQASFPIRDGENRTDITVTYLSRRFFSINVTAGYNCGGPYPVSAQSPMTFDMTAGRIVDWKTMFTPGFWPPQGADGGVPGLTKLYRARYHPEDTDEDCRDAVMNQAPFTSAPIVMLDAKKGLVVWPEFPHVIQACADPVTLTASDLAPYVKDQNLLADLRATVKSNPGKGAVK